MEVRLNLGQIIPDGTQKSPAGVISPLVDALSDKVDR
jgi:hypothetical protein